MNCCQCQGIESIFNERRVERDLKNYREKGPAKTSRALIDAITARGIGGKTLLDIGGGVGAIQHGLLEAGVVHATCVDASAAYIEIGKREAVRRELTGRTTYLHGDVVEIAERIDPADIVTLDRVLCCYHDMGALVRSSATKARQLYGLVFPRDTWWTHFAADKLLNVALRLRRSSFRLFVHETEQVEAVLRELGFKPISRKEIGFWQVALFSRIG